MSERTEILGIPIDNINFSEAYEKIEEFLNENSCKAVYTPNSEMLYMASRNNKFREILSSGDLILPDGMGVILASKLIKKTLKQKVSGVDIVKGILSKYSLKVFLLGGKPGIAKKAGEEIESTYKNIKVIGTHHGYFKDNDNKKILEMINKESSDLLIVCLSMKKQEEWIYNNKSALRVKIAIGAGGTLDILSGAVSLTPEIIRKTGFEWLHRLIREPKRIKRMSVIPVFLLKVLFKRHS
jgi:exopolysaccharide biosynthesis WecB/TagA/CpsF family protein